MDQKSSFEVLFEIASKRICMMYHAPQYWSQLQELSNKRLIFGFNRFQKYAIVSLTIRGDRLMQMVDGI